MTNSDGPLRGMRVVELATFIAGPFAGQLLADMGADVIKVEQPGDGDPFRAFGGSLYAPHFVAYNRNKRSIALDARSEHGKPILRRLLERADVFLENFRPGVMQRLGLDYETVRDWNPRLIYCSVTGFGQSGPYRDRPSYDGV
ncbi:MAG TPA: CaiB/BaiF CoA-transferase family protein, partial [Chloroflexota bacterium]